MSKAPWKKMLDVECGNGQFWYNFGKDKIDLTGIKCDKALEPSIIVDKTVKHPCAPDKAAGGAGIKNFKAQIGWYIKGIFKPQIELCIDDSAYATLWAKA